MKKNNYTHELRFNAKKIYPMKVLELSNVINKDFEEIDNIRIAYLPNGTNY